MRNAIETKSVRTYHILNYCLGFAHSSLYVCAVCARHLWTLVGVCIERSLFSSILCYIFSHLRHYHFGIEMVYMQEESPERPWEMVSRIMLYPIHSSLRLWYGKYISISIYIYASEKGLHAQSIGNNGTLWPPVCIVHSFAMYYLYCYVIINAFHLPVLIRRLRIIQCAVHSAHTVTSTATHCTSFRYTYVVHAHIYLATVWIDGRRQMCRMQYGDNWLHFDCI